MSASKKPFTPPRNNNSYQNLANNVLVQEKEALQRKLEVENANPAAEDLAKTMTDLANANGVKPSAETQVKQPQISQDQPHVSHTNEPESKPEEKPLVEAEKPRVAAKPKNSGTTEAVTVENGEVVFNEPFQTNQIKRSDFGGLNYAAPRQVILEAKMRAMRDGLTILEVQNLLLAMYVESGLPSSLMKRYKKVEKKD